MKRFLPLILIPLMVLGCAQFQRSAGSGYQEDNGYSTTRARSQSGDRLTRQTAYELGKDPSSLTADDYEQIRARQKLRELERTLISKKEKEQYSKILPWLVDDHEKISFLVVPSIEGRQQWINRNNIWGRAQAPQTDIKELVESQDIAIGMPQDYVKKSWGEPMNIEVSGNPIYKNERWKYQRQVSTSQGFRKETRHVYFEGGRVVGWETE